MTKGEIVERARYALTHSRARYRLGAGGYAPGDRLPGQRTGSLDCSGFVAWCMNLSRKSFDVFLTSVNGGWIETTGIVKDALSPEGIFTEVKRAEPGDLIVWGDQKGRQGHVGVVVEVNGGVPTRVIHASMGNDRATGKAIQETGPEIFFRNKAIYASLDSAVDVEWYEPEEPVVCPLPPDPPDFLEPEVEPRPIPIMKQAPKKKAAVKPKAKPKAASKK